MERGPQALAAVWRKRTPFGNQCPFALTRSPTLVVTQGRALSMEQEQSVRVGRRLAAILAADVAGYSRLMGLNARQPRRGGYAQSYPQLGPSFPI